jgi:hypothetical protein
LRIRTRGYRTAVAAFGTLALLSGCGGGSSSSSISDVKEAVQVRNPDSSEVQCERHGSYQGNRLYRCRVEVPTSVREMRPSPSCYTFEHGRLVNVTRHVSC